MVQLRRLHRRMIIKGIIADDVVEILDLHWLTTDQLTVTCQDTRKRLHNITLNSMHESQLECVNASMLPWDLLPQNPGKEDMRTLTKTDKKLLNQSLTKSGFKLQWDKEGGFSDWTYGNITYRVFHANPRQSFIMLRETETATSLQSETKTIPQVTAAKRNNDLPSPLSTIEELASTFPVPVPQWISRAQFLPGMYVRIPFPPNQEGDFRDFSIGRISSFNEIADTVIVSLEYYVPGEDPVLHNGEWSRDQVQRCHILPQTSFTHLPTSKTGIVLAMCDDEWQDGEYCHYYVWLNDCTIRLPEYELSVAAHRGDPDPCQQLANYELHNPIFKFNRDRLVESYAELQSATYGMEDMIGSRVILLPHQADVITRVLSDNQCRYILADEVGLGKTVEACVILKGLRRRHPGLKALIITPPSLTKQWYNELDEKFWLRFASFQDAAKVFEIPAAGGLIISTERLIADKPLTQWLKRQPWGLLIVDEAHHIHKWPELFQNIFELSQILERVLILSATPIQRHTTEFLALLKLMNPKHYGHLEPSAFQQMLNAQYRLLPIVASIAHDLTPDYFDAQFFLLQMNDVLKLLPNDALLREKVGKVAQAFNDLDQGLSLAREAITYISENYRIERRVIRNRRVNLDIKLPERRIEDTYIYKPDKNERDALEDLYEYLDRLIAGHKASPPVLEYARLLLHAAFSSPHTLNVLLQKRHGVIKSNRIGRLPPAEWRKLVVPSAPRQEQKRVDELISALPVTPGEQQWLSSLQWHVETWEDSTTVALKGMPYGAKLSPQPHRLWQVIAAIVDQLTSHPAAKIVIFSTWPTTLNVLKESLRKRFGSQSMAEFHALVPLGQLQEAVDRFQSVEECHLLLCDELGGEGRNFQIADVIIHVDLPWTPAQLEQRIGRVDRLGRDMPVVSLVCYTRGHLEEDLHNIWQNAFHIFTQSLSGLEIALEGVQDELLSALSQGVRNSLYHLLEPMRERAETLRQQVDEERYYELEVINRRFRQELSRLFEHYQDGKRLRGPILSWADKAGLHHTYNTQTDTVRYYPTQFSLQAMQNARMVTVPNMEDAHRRSGRQNEPHITGTFNRLVAILQEEFVFFAPGSDPWTNAIIESALQNDRGRACAIRRQSMAVTEPWEGVEFFYRVMVDPRPLFELGLNPVYLYRTLGYLQIPVYRLLVSASGEVMPRSHQLYKVVANLFNRRDTHLGKRGGTSPPLAWFAEKYPPERWTALLKELTEVAEAVIAEEFSFMSEVAAEAKDDFDQVVRGMRAAMEWQRQQKNVAMITNELASNENYEQISTALVDGIGRPWWRLESACFWIIEPEKDQVGIP